MSAYVRRCFACRHGSHGICRDIHCECDHRSSAVGAVGIPKEGQG